MAHIEIKPHAGSVRVIWRGRVVATSERALDLVEGGGRPVLYVPREDADMSVFVPTAKHTHCPHKARRRISRSRRTTPAMSTRSGPTRRRSTPSPPSRGIWPSTRTWSAWRADAHAHGAEGVNLKIC